MAAFSYKFTSVIKFREAQLLDLVHLPSGNCDKTANGMIGEW
jgi:hypothetical protein